MTTPWVTDSQVTEMTGVDVTTASIARAATVLSVITGRDLSDPAAYTTRDARLIAQAVAYQAAFMTENPEAVTAPDLAAASVGSTSMTRAPGATTAALAPLARIALRRVSWARSRSVKVLSDDDLSALADTLDDTVAPAALGWSAPTRI